MNGDLLTGPTYCNTASVLDKRYSYKKEETCAGECSARLLYFRQAPIDRVSVLHLIDRMGYDWCGHCRRIMRTFIFQQLVHCPSCSRYFRGPRKQMPIDYECKDC